MSFIAVFSLILSMSTCCVGQLSIGRDVCVDEVYQRFHVPLLSRYMAYTNFTNSLPTSRNLYQAMFIQRFTSPAFYDYCTTYRRARSEFDNCPWSTYKDMVINGYGLADFMCYHRVNDYARHLPCLQNAHFLTLSQCNQRCFQFQNVGGSIGFNNPYPNMISYYDPNQQMAADCQYQRCLAECRRPLFEQQCGRDASRLELEALYATYASIRNIHEPPEQRRQYERGYYDRGFSNNAFPAECFALAINSAKSIFDFTFVIILILSIFI